MRPIFLLTIIGLMAFGLWQMRLYYIQYIYTPPFPCKNTEPVGQCLVREALKQGNCLTPDMFKSTLVYGDEKSISTLENKLQCMDHDGGGKFLKKLEGSKLVPGGYGMKTPEGYDYKGKIYHTLLHSLHGDVRPVANVLKEEMNAAYSIMKQPIWGFRFVLSVLLARGQLDDAVEFVRQTQDISMARLENEPNVRAARRHAKQEYFRSAERKRHVLVLVSIALMQSGRGAEAVELIEGVPSDSYYLLHITKDDLLSYFSDRPDELRNTLDDNIGAPWTQKTREDGRENLHVASQLLDSADKDQIMSLIPAGAVKVDHELNATTLARILAFNKSQDTHLLENIWQPAIAPCWSRRIYAFAREFPNDAVLRSCLFNLLPQLPYRP